MTGGRLVRANAHMKAYGIGIGEFTHTRTCTHYDSLSNSQPSGLWCISVESKSKVCGAGARGSKGYIERITVIILPIYGGRVGSGLG